MHILYLVPHVPNPTKIRSYFQVRGLIEAGHRVTVVTLDRSDMDSKNIAKLEQSGAKVISVKLSRVQSLWNVFQTLPTSRPLQSRFMWSAKLMAGIRTLLATDPPDVIHVEHLRMACYALLLVAKWSMIWDAVDYLSALYQQAGQRSQSPMTRLVYAIEGSRLAFYEQWLTSQFPATLVISTKDQSLFQEGNPQPKRIHYQPQGLPITEQSVTSDRESKRLVITGTLNYHPNVASVHYFVRDILPLIQRQIPDIQLHLVGANPNDSIKALTNSNIKITGFVPSIMDYLCQSTIALAPVTYGSGIQIKVLEAFLTATPLVATSVAVRGLDVQHEREVLIADTPEAFAKAVVRLLGDADLRQRIGEAGRKYVEQNHDLRQTTAHLVGIYEQVIAEKTR